MDFERKLLTVGADADTKNREARRVDFNAQLEMHLKAMQARRAPNFGPTVVPLAQAATA